MHKVVLISLHFPPSAASGAFRMLGFARHLPSFGWKPSVVTCERVPFEPVDPVLQLEVPSETPVRYIHYPNTRLDKIGRRALMMTGIVDPHAIWCYTARRACHEWLAIERPDAVLTSGPPHSVHLLGRWLKRYHRIRTVMDLRDSWTTTASPARPSAILRRMLERATVRASDGVIANSPNALAAMVARYPECAHRMTMIPNGFDPEASLEETPARDEGDPVTILHAGELYAGRDPRALLDAIGEAERSTALRIPWRLRFVGRTDECGLDIVAEAKRRHLRSEVAVGGQIAYGLVKEAMRQASMLLLIDGPGRTVGVPAKLYEYLGANRPILALAAPDGDTAWALRSSGAVYRIARPDDAAAIGNALAELTDEAGFADSGAAVAASSPFTRERLAGELATFLDRVVSERAPR